MNDILTLATISAGGLAAIGGLILALRLLYYFIRSELLPFRGGASMLLLSIVAAGFTVYLFILLFGANIQ
jgi:hypothetical protein